MLKGNRKSRPDRLKIFTRRALILAGVKGALIAGLAVRMYYLQVVENSRYQKLAEDNRISIRLLAPARGHVLDRFGRVLASNRADYRAYIVPEQTESVAATLDELGEIIPLDANDRSRILTAAKRQRSFFPITVAENLSWEEFARINISSPDLPGVQPDVGTTRFYPYGQLTAHLLGYVGAPNEEEAGNNPLLHLPSFKIGKNGLERTFDEALRGVAGNMQVEVNAYGRVIRELNQIAPVQGNDLRLTVDLELQKYAAERISAESASAVVLDISNGDILALASMPAFDPNDFNVGIRRDTWNMLLNDVRKPLVNKAVQGQYPPGSTFKMVVAMAALEAGVVSAAHQVFCPGKRRLGNHVFHCWKREGHGTLDMVGAIKHSCDVYFYDIADKVGVDKIAEMSHRFGLGERYDIAIPHVAAGLIPTAAWKRGRFGVSWQRGENLVVGIGQGYVLSTPLQLAVMTARIANGGYAVMPRLVRPRIDTPPPRLPVSDLALATVQQGMVEVTTSPRGTAYAARITEPGMGMAGKTGTAQVRRISKEERATRVRKNEEKPWIERDHALFVGYGPIEAPRYAVAVVVEHGGSGSKIAAPIARDILLQAQRLQSGRDPNVPPPAPSPALREV